MKWMSFRQGAKTTLSEYISKFNSLHTDLLLTVYLLMLRHNYFNSKLVWIPNVSLWKL